MTDAGEVIARHVAAVRTGDPDGMAADYACDAVLVRPDRTHRGRSEIRAYFATVSCRLGDGRVQFGDTTVSGSTVTIRWRIDGGPAHGTCGTDTCKVVDGYIARQRVDLAGHDF